MPIKRQKPPPAIITVLALVALTCECAVKAPHHANDTVHPPPQADFYVAPDGADTNRGTREQPFATISRARDAVRLKVAAGLGVNVIVWIRGGTYRMNEPVVFGPEDGGTDVLSVTYAAYPEEIPVFSGGRVITGWKKGGNGKWTVEVPDVRAGDWSFRELFVGRRRATRARHPNQGWLRVAKVGKDRRTRFQFQPGDLRAYGDLKQLELIFLHDWSITRTLVSSIDEETHTLIVPHQIGGPARWAVMDWFEKQPRYFVENSVDFLDVPGEWCLNEDSGILTYLPRPGEEPGVAVAVAPFARQLLVVRGDRDGKRPVRNLHFSGLRFAHAAWHPPEGVYWGRQACTYWTMATTKAGRNHEEADPAAVQFEEAETCSFTDGVVEHVGTSGIWLGTGCRDCRVIETRVSDVGGNGIMIGEGKARMVGGAPWWQAAPEQAASGNSVAENLVEACGRELYGAVGVWVGLAAKTSIANNEIRHLPYTGVSVGWMWWNPRDRAEPLKTPCRRNLVERNHIHHVMQTLSDGAGIYTLGAQPESALRGNLIHDVPTNAGRAESNGMFLDQGTGDFVIENNVIHGVSRSPLRFHKGWKNLVRNNVLAVGEGIPVVRYNDTKQERITLESNTVVSAGSAELVKAIAEAESRVGLGPSRRQGLLEGDAGAR